MTVEVWQTDRPKGRPPRWAFRVMTDGAAAFESASVSVRYATRADASWLAELIDSLVARGWRPNATALTPTLMPAAVRWEGDLSDDCWAAVGDLRAHAEHLQGPRRGGVWYCSVSRAGEPLFHTADRGVEPRSGEAARWVCEVVMLAAQPRDAEASLDEA